VPRTPHSPPESCLQRRRSSKHSARSCPAGSVAESVRKMLVFQQAKVCCDGCFSRVCRVDRYLVILITFPQTHFSENFTVRCLGCKIRHVVGEARSPQQLEAGWCEPRLVKVYLGH
jgi:hypothetical protein